MTDAQPREYEEAVQAPKYVSRPPKIDPRTGQPYPYRTEAEWATFRVERDARDAERARKNAEWNERRGQASNEAPPAKRAYDPEITEAAAELPAKQTQAQLAWPVGTTGGHRPQRGPFNIVDVQRAGTLQEALEKYVYTPGDSNGIRFLWDIRPRVAPKYELEDPYTWQRALKAELDEPRNQRDGRKLPWLWNADGNVGMSTFCRWLTQGNEENVLTLQQGGRMGDVAHTIAHHVSTYGHGPKIILVDLGRAVARRNIYATLENMLNGAMFSSKYESRSVFFEKPHVVCFANWPPETSAQTLSEDRWDVRRIKTNAKARGFAVAEPMTLAQVRTARSEMKTSDETLAADD